MSILNPDHNDYVLWICDRSIEKGKRTIGLLLDRPSEREPKLDVAKVLGDALGREVKGQNRRALKNAIQSALAKLEKATTALAKPGKPSKAIDGKAEIVTSNEAMDLDSIKTALEWERDTVIQHEQAYKDAILPRFCRMGLQCLKAQHLFAITDPAKRGQGRKGKAAAEISSPGELISEEPAEPTSFAGWLSSAVPWLNQGSAYKYLRAAEGLGLTHESTEKDLDKALTAARKKLGEGKKLTLTLLTNKTPLEVEPGDDPNTPEAKAAEARVQADAWITSWDRSVKAGNLEHADVDTLKALDEFLTNTRDHIRKRIRSSAA